MDAQDQNRTSPTGHGVHLCRKCGWPFLNPHPSSKHRRAHKKVCGKVEGYLMNISHSGCASDDDNSDDDMQTPSPKMDKENMKEPGSSGGSGLLRSSKSEDEVFSDAVMEFSESGSSPSTQESMERTKQLGKNVGKELANDLVDVQQIKDEEHNNMEKVVDDATRGSEEAVGNTTSHSDSKKSANYIRVLEFPVGVDQIDGELINSPDIASENGNSDKTKELISSEPDTNVEGKRSATELECSMTHVASLSYPATEEPKLEIRPDELKKQGSRNVELDCVTPEVDIKTSDTVILEPKLQEADMNMLHSSAMDEATGQENELRTVSGTGNVILGHVLDIVDGTEQCQTDILQADETEHGLSSQIAPPKDADVSSTRQVEADSTEEQGHVKLVEDNKLETEADETEHNLSSQIAPPKDADVSSTRQVEADFTEENGHAKLVEDNELEVEGCKEVLPVSVSESLPVIEEPKIMIEDFEDYEVPKSSNPLDLGNAEVTRPVEIDEKVVTEPDPSNISSLTRSQSDVSTSINLQKDALESVGEEIDTTTLQVISEEGTRTNGAETHHNTLNHCPEVILKSTQGLELGNNNKLGSTGALGADSEFCPEDHIVASGKQLENSKDTEAPNSISSIGDVSELNLADQDEVTKKNSEDFVYEEPAVPVISNKIPAAVEDTHIKDLTESELLIDKAENKLTVENLSVSAVDDSAVSCSRTESLEGNWGSVSVLSTQSDGMAHTDAEALEKSEGTLLKPQATSDAYRPEKLDIYEPPSFMTLVKPRSELEKTVEASEITEPSKSEAVDAGWIPSLTSVVNESEGRKKNEEIIAKVTNWSPGKQHSPLKNLLNEAHAEKKVETATTEKQLPPKDHTDETASKVATVSSIMRSETPVHDAAKRGEMDKEWNSPARYPTAIKKEKKKGKPYWVPFVCCTSAQRDM